MIALIDMALLATSKCLTGVGTPRWLDEISSRGLATDVPVLGRQRRKLGFYRRVVRSRGQVSHVRTAYEA